jgi:hypothetical protein
MIMPRELLAGLAGRSCDAKGSWCPGLSGISPGRKLVDSVVRQEGETSLQRLKLNNVLRSMLFDCRFFGLVIYFICAAPVPRSTDRLQARQRDPPGGLFVF